MIVNLKNRIWGVDVSHWQDYADTEKKPDLKMLKDAGCRFVIARSLDGYTENGKPRIDRLFWYYIEEALKNGMAIANYAYLNYYSHPYLKINSTQWGEMQGNVVADIIRQQWMRTFIDAEKSPLVDGKIELVWNTVLTIADNMIKKIDDATGEATGWYLPTGWLRDYLPPYHKMRPLLAANYNNVTEDYVKGIVKAAGCTDLKIIQVNSLGDINGDKIPDGRKLGFENPNVDIDVFVGSEEDFNNFFFRAEQQPKQPPIVIEIPDDEVKENPNMVMIEKKTVKINGLRIRTSKTAPTLLSMVAPDKLNAGDEVYVLHRVVSGKYTWIQIGFRQWCCEREVINGKDVIYID